jgi:hypothetical protein
VSRTSLSQTRVERLQRGSQALYWKGPSAAAGARSKMDISVETVIRQMIIGRRQEASFGAAVIAPSSNHCGAVIDTA